LELGEEDGFTIEITRPHPGPGAEPIGGPARTSTAVYALALARGHEGVVAKRLALAPSAARRLAIAAPMPREPPVTSATLPVSGPSSEGGRLALLARGPSLFWQEAAGRMLRPAFGGPEEPNCGIDFPANSRTNYGSATPSWRRGRSLAKTLPQLPACHECL
jgi:hypothetical protein